MSDRFQRDLISNVGVVNKKDSFKSPVKYLMLPTINNLRACSVFVGDHDPLLGPP